MSDSKGIYQPWCHEQFMADRRVRRMSPIAAKTYMMLLHEAYNCSTRPHLPDDEEELELMAYCTDGKEWQMVKNAVLGMFEKKVVDGIPVLVNKRLERDWDNLLTIRGERSKAGKAGAEARWGSKNSKEMANAIDPMAKNSKEVSKEVKESEAKEENGEDFMKTDRQIDMMTQQFFGKKAFLRGRNGEDLKTLILVHKGSAVERAYGEWCQQNSDNPDIHDPVAVFLEAADEYLGTATRLPAAAKDPEVVGLARELTYVSSGLVAFQDKQRVRLAEVLKEFSATEIKQAFSAWLGDQDLSDSKNVSFLAGKFVQIADSLCYTSRRKKQESDDARALREVAAERLQAEAEEERRRAEKKRKEEEESFDPLA